MWNGESLDEATRGRVVGLFRLTFRNPAVVAASLGEDAVFLILAMSNDRIVRVKPQNLVTGLPIRHLEAVS